MGLELNIDLSFQNIESCGVFSRVLAGSWVSYRIQDLALRSDILSLKTLRLINCPLITGRSKLACGLVGNNTHGYCDGIQEGG